MGMQARASWRWRLPFVAGVVLSLGCSSSNTKDAEIDPGATGTGAAPATSSTTSGSTDTSSSNANAGGSSSASTVGTSGVGTETSGSGGATTDAGAGTDAGGTGGASSPTTSGTTGSGGEATTGSGGTGGDAVVEPDPTDLGPVTLYYLNVTEALVMTVGAEGGQPDVVVQDAGQGPDGIAVDPDGGHIFWTNMGVPAEENGFILRSDLDGSNVTTIVEEGDTYTPKQLKLEPETEKLYWGDREGMRVQRCNLDGSELETLVTIAEGEQARADRANHAVGISVDTAGGYFYWIQKGPPNGGEGSIRRAGLEMPQGENDQTRTDIEVLYSGLPEPIDLDVDVDGGMMYWTDRGDATINRAPIDIPDGASADTRDDREILVDGVDVAIGIWLDLPLGHVYYTGNDVVGRVDLDGSNNETLVPNAGVLTGITAVRLP